MGGPPTRESGVGVGGRGRSFRPPSPVGARPGRLFVGGRRIGRHGGALGADPGASVGGPPRAAVASPLAAEGPHAQEELERCPRGTRMDPPPRSLPTLSTRVPSLSPDQGGPSTPGPARRRGRPTTAVVAPGDAADVARWRRAASAAVGLRLAADPRSPGRRPPDPAAQPRRGGSHRGPHGRARRWRDEWASWGSGRRSGAPDCHPRPSTHVRASPPPGPRITQQDADQRARTIRSPRIFRTPDARRAGFCLVVGQLVTVERG